MKFRWTPHFKKDYQRLPQKTKKKLAKQLNFLSSNLRHPSLRVKKMKGLEEIWEARIDGFYRFTFEIIEGMIYLYRIGPHDQVLRKKR